MRYLYAILFIIISIVYMVIIYKVVNKNIKNKVLNCVLDVFFVFIFSFLILYYCYYMKENNINGIPSIVDKVLNAKIIPSKTKLAEVKIYITLLPWIYSLAVSIKKFDKSLTSKTVIGAILSILCFIIMLKL